MGIVASLVQWAHSLPGTVGQGPFDSIVWGALLAATGAMLLSLAILRRRRIVGGSAATAPASVAAPIVPLADNTTASGSGEAPLILCNGRREAGSEAFRALRTQLLLLVQEQRLRHLLVTSSGPGEGKSTIAANIALATARAGHKVLLIDADLHRPQLANAFTLPNTPGLADTLRNTDDRSSAADPTRYCRRTRVPNLDLLSAGALNDDAAEVLASGEMRQLIEAFGREYELVVYDSPPVLSVADPTVLATQVDGVLLVVRAGRYPRDAIRQAHTELEAVHAKMLGAVLNGVEPGGGGTYYGHYRYSYYA